ncbi:MAG: S1/P1 Nuclease [Bacteroidia bacterium]|nr:S1/P1 Nuclease [Bacteroidia bacterium]
MGFAGFIAPLLSNGWGFYAHQQINKLSVFCLPPELFGFYKLHIDFISQHAVDPDKRRYQVKEEAVKHYIDIDYYEQVLPLDTIPQRFMKAVEKFSKDTLFTYGIVPWNITWVLKDLTEAFKNKDEKRILKLSAEIGHYIGDAHVPLHTTSNYNGQTTQQHGIHGFLESRLPELFAGDYNFFMGKAVYIDDPLRAAWQAVEGSFACLDSVFGFEKQLQGSFKENQRYSFEPKGRNLIKVYSAAYAKAYHQKLNGMIERRMQLAVICVASFWYTAWINAGQPDLSKLINSEKLILESDADTLLSINQKMIGREE